MSSGLCNIGSRNPADYLFKMGSPEKIARLRCLPVPATIRTPRFPTRFVTFPSRFCVDLVGDTSVDAVLTFGRETIASSARQEIQQTLDDFEAGVEIVTVKLQSTSPPELVKDAFQEVNRAHQNKERVVNEAEGERNSKIPAARGKRDQTISEAEGYRERILLETKGRVSAFLAQLNEYEKAPEVTRTRLYLEAMEKLLTQVQDKTIIDDSVQGLIPLLNLDASGSPRGSAAQSPARGGVQ